MNILALYLSNVNFTAIVYRRFCRRSQLVLFGHLARKPVCADEYFPRFVHFQRDLEALAAVNHLVRHLNSFYYVIVQADDALPARL